MIISHKHRFIFIKSKKTAGTSIEMALCAICGDEDVITAMNPEDESLRFEKTGRNAQNTRIPLAKYSLKDWGRFLLKGKRAHFYNHMTAREVKRYIGSAVWNNYYTFCFDRDPVTKAISHFKWRGKKVHFESFEAYLSSVDINMIKGDVYYADAAGNSLVDEVFKMEDIPGAFVKIKAEIGSDELKAPDFKTKQSTGSEELSPEYVREHFGDTLKTIFKTEYNTLYKE